MSKPFCQLMSEESASNESILNHKMVFLSLRNVLDVQLCILLMVYISSIRNIGAECTKYHFATPILFIHWLYQTFISPAIHVCELCRPSIFLHWPAHLTKYWYWYNFTLKRRCTDMYCDGKIILCTCIMKIKIPVQFVAVLSPRLCNFFRNLFLVIGKNLVLYDTNAIFLVRLYPFAFEKNQS